MSDDGSGAFPSDVVEEAPPSRDIVSCPATWSPDLKGWIVVRDPFDGSRHEISYSAATEVWKEDLRRLRRARVTRTRSRS